MNETLKKISAALLALAVLLLFAAEYGNLVNFFAGDAMFFGVTSSRISGASCWRRQRFLSAIATARLASFWPTM